MSFDVGTETADAQCALAPRRKAAVVISLCAQAALLRAEVPRLDRFNAHALYKLAAGLAVLRYTERNQMAVDFGFSLLMAEHAVERYLAEGVALPLPLSLAALNKFVAEIRELQEQYPVPGGLLGIGAIDEKKEADKWDVDRVRRSITNFETLLTAECERYPAFSPPKRGIYDTDDLVNAASKSIPPQLQALLPDKAIDV